ncbi:MAG: hypothetical protein IJ042_01940 [Butyricicoccus sp.]|nr:hypothetical protein [Butyricicoccus sp.]
MAPCFTSIGGVQREKSSLIGGVGGVQRELASAVAGIGGVQREIFGPKGVALSTFAVGSIVKLNENGSPVEFYVANHDYDSGLNGSGRTLLVRKDCYDTRAWGSSMYSVDYAGSSISSWLNSTYKALLDADVQNLIGTTKFYYTADNTSTSVSTMSRAIFILSVKELGKTSSFVNTEGSSLGLGSILQKVYLNGSAVAQWTRSPRQNASTVCAISSSGNVTSKSATTVYGSRPCFTLPSTAIFDPDTLQFISA